MKKQKKNHNICGWELDVLTLLLHVLCLDKVDES